MTMIGKIPFKTKPADPPAAPTELQQLIALVTKQGESLTALSTELTALKAAKPAPAPPAPDPMRTQPTQPKPGDLNDPNYEPTEEDLNANPLGVMNFLAERAARNNLERGAGPVMNAAFTSRLEQLRAGLKEEHKGMYDFLAEDMKAFEKTIPIEVLTQTFPDGTTGLGRAFQQVLGKNFGRVMGELKKLPLPRPKQDVPFTEQGGPRQTPTLTADDRLSDAERDVASRLGLTPEQYIETRKASVITSPDMSRFREDPNG